jgi:hypothetical protein
MQGITIKVKDCPVVSSITCEAQFPISTNVPYIEQTINETVLPYVTLKRKSTIQLH